MGTLVTLALAASVAYAISRWLTPPLIHLLRAHEVMDEPSERSSHTTSTPRGGGLALLIGLVVGLGICTALGLVDVPPVLWPALGLAAAGGLADDLRGGVAFIWRLLLQLAAALLILWSMGPLERLPLPAPLDLTLGPWGWPFGVLWFLGVMNLVNFLDGIDGFATGQALLAGLGLALAGGLAPERWLLACGTVLLAAAAGFLHHNWSPARVFLGDVGSTSIGFFLAAVPWAATGVETHAGVLLVALLIWFFLVDGSFTLFRRAMRAERVWEPHREHLYQRLVQSGLGHDQVALRILGMGVLPGALGVLGTVMNSAQILWAALASGLVLVLSLWRSVVVRERVRLE